MPYLTPIKNELVDFYILLLYCIPQMANNNLIP